MFAGRPIIGLAGGIGAGKSHVARLMEAAGACRVDSDDLVRAAYTHPAVKRAVLERFGEAVLDPGGGVDRKQLAKIVFDDPAQRRWLEQLIHPVVNQARVEIMADAANDEAVRAYVWDSPLLFETRLSELCDATVFVDAPSEDRLDRVKGRGWDGGELGRREKAQWPVDKKAAAADHRLANGEAEPATPESAAALLDEIVAATLPSAGCCGGSSGSSGSPSSCQDRPGGCACAATAAATA